MAHPALLLGVGIAVGAGGFALGQYLFISDPFSKKLEVWVTDSKTQKKKKLTQEEIQKLFNKNQALETKIAQLDSDLQTKIGKLTENMQAQEARHHQEMEELKKFVQALVNDRLPQPSRDERDLYIENTGKLLQLVEPYLWSQQAPFPEKLASTDNRASNDERLIDHLSEDDDFEHLTGDVYDGSKQRPN